MGVSPDGGGARGRLGDWLPRVGGGALWDAGLWLWERLLRDACQCAHDVKQNIACPGSTPAYVMVITERRTYRSWYS